MDFDLCLPACEGNDELERRVQAGRDRQAMFGSQLNVERIERLTTDLYE